MTSSSSQGNHNVINLNVVPSAAPEVWRPYFLSPNGSVTVIDSVILNGTTAMAVAAGLLTPEDGRRLLKDNKKKVGELKEENKGLKKLVDSYANDLVARSTEQSKTTTELQKQYEKLLVEETHFAPGLPAHRSLHLLSRLILPNLLLDLFKIHASDRRAVASGYRGEHASRSELRRACEAASPVTHRRVPPRQLHHRFIWLGSPDLWTRGS
uniref:Uncharacterized protein n=1 Tax=Fagus sylvatica TaxID=28930 RepID=A0A2N9H1N2_FAGSY